MSEVVLEAKDLTKYYGQALALDHLNISIEKGGVYGFVGRNGAGKTTAIKLFMGLLTPTAGSASVFGCDCQKLTPEVRQRLGYVTEGHRLLRELSIRDIAKFQKAFFPGQWDDKFFDEMIDYFELPRKRKIKKLSNGQRAQVSLALTLAPHPELLIMDDPTLGLDAAIRRQFLEGMIHLIMEQGRTVLFSSHILGDVERVVDRLIVIDKGVLRASCTTEQFREAIKKVRFSFEEDPPKEVDISGCLNCRRSDNSIELVLVNTTEQEIEDWFGRNNAKEYEVIQTNLEDQFIDYTSHENHGKLFKWEGN